MKAQEQNLPSVSTDEINSILTQENIAITDNYSMPNANELFLNWGNEIPSVDVKDVPKNEIVFAEEEIFHSSIENAIENALT